MVTTKPTSSIAFSSASARGPCAFEGDSPARIFLLKPNAKTYRTIVNGRTPCDHDHKKRSHNRVLFYWPELKKPLFYSGLSFGGRTRARTWDPLIKSQLLYQLSYAPGVLLA